MLDELVRTLSLGQTDIIHLYNSTDVNLAVVVVLVRCLWEWGYEGTYCLLPSCSRVSKRLDPITFVTGTWNSGTERFIYLDNLNISSAHCSRKTFLRGLFWLIAHPSSLVHSTCIPLLLRLVIYSFIGSPLGSDTNNVPECYRHLMSKDVSTIHAS